MFKDHPRDYAVILWDFDGVIINSNQVREFGFREVLKDYPAHQVEELLSYHNANGGLSRYVKFRHFFEMIRGETVTNERVNQLALAFSEIMLRQLPNRDLLIEDSVNFINESFNRGIEQHIVSGSDQKELRKLCGQLEISKYFTSIQGSPESKTNIVKQLVSNMHNYRNDVCLIGDSINDFQAARDNRIAFFGYNNIELTTLSVYIKALSES